MLAFRIALHLALGVSAPGIGGEAVVEFEGLPLGTVYGAPAAPPHMPEELVYNEAGIRMSVETFYSTQVLTDFSDARVVTADLGRGPSNALALNSIGVRFDFVELGFPVGQVTIDIFDHGGTSNFAVNGGGLQILDALTDLQADVAPGVLASFNGSTVTVTGVTADITDLQIGGQELVIDHIAAVPDPATGLLLLGGAFVFVRRGQPARRRDG
jgi:hypothetical protein